MRRVATATAALVLVGTCLVLNTSSAAADPITSGALVRLTGSATPVPTGAAVLGPAALGGRITVEVALKPRDPAALADFVRAVSTPGNPHFHHYLAAGQLAATFGPTPATLAATRQWLASTGLHVGPTSRDGLLIPLTGSASQVEVSFDTPLVEVRLASGRTARFAVGDPLVPAGLSGSMAGVIGLSEQLPATPSIVRGAPLAGSAGRPQGAARPASVGPQPCPAIAGMSSVWTADKLAATYGLTSLYGSGRTGAGQTVGVYELEPYSPPDVQAYQACYGLNVPVTNINIDGGSSSSQSGEAALDIEAVAGLAPGAALEVYTGPNYGTGPIDTYERMVTDDTAKVLSVSWGQCESQTNPTDRTTESAIFAMAAAQGQTVLAASGDSGSSDCYNPLYDPTAFGLAVDDPAAQPDVTGVGGTSLTSVSTTAPTETAWNSGGAGGGGNSAYFVAPAWQQVPAVQSVDTAYNCSPSGTQQCRQVPDVSASADPNYGDAISFAGGWWSIGGTSAASPLWAAVVAVTNQGCATTAGLISPALYAPGASTAFNDVMTGTNSLFQGPHYTARTGYDLATGWGSPRAGALLTLLSGSAAGCPTVTGLSPSSGRALGGTPVTISGTGFGSGVPVVHFGSISAQVTASTPTSVTVVTPNVNVGGTVGVTVTTAGTAAGTSPVVAASQFTFLSPQVVSVVSDHGPLAGGGQVTIHGSGFSDATAVTFGSTPATTFQVNSPTTITATVPPGTSTSTPADVVVVGPLGTSPVTPGSAYYYALPGYLMVASDGGVFTYGGAGFFGSGGNLGLVSPMVGVAMTPSAQGYWMVGANGHIFPFGAAGFYGSAGQLTLAHPMVGMAATPDGRGYWLVASDGGIFAYGDAAFYGSTGNLTLNEPIVGMAATPDGLGYWLVASDGGIFAYGDAAFYGSTGNLTLNRPIVGMSPSSDGHGYWLVASDGGIFAYGDAQFHGSTGALTLNQPIVGMSVDLTGDGYWLVASDGGIFAFGSAPFYGSTGNIRLNQPIVGMAAT
jgi:subtilase family serine protease